MDLKKPSEVSITDLFDQFIEAATMKNVLSTYHRILNYSNLSPCEFNIFFPRLKSAVMTDKTPKNWKAKALFSKIDKRAAYRCYANGKLPTPLGNRRSDNNSDANEEQELEASSSIQSNRICYNNNALINYNCLIIGSGPAGLRTAIELQLLGASRVVIVEKRSRFSRNNVLHLWPFVIDDLKRLGAKKFYGKFCAGSIDHISIRQLQLILLKVCLMIGCDFKDSCSYSYLCPSSLTSHPSIISGNNSDIKTEIDYSCDNSENVKQKCCFDKKNLVSQTELSRASSELVVIDTKENSQVFEASNPCSEKSEIPTGSNYSLTAHHQAPEIKTSFKEKENLRGVRAHFQSEHSSNEVGLHNIEWDVIIGADGRRNTLNKFFPRKEFRGRLAIAITANFINRQTPVEAAVPEISGLSFIYNQDMFNALAHDTNIELENICYYKDDTHYFVMTAKKRSLLDCGVLIKDYATTHDLLSESNIDRQALLKYAKDAAFWTTGLEPLDFALNHYGQEDCAMFDFTSMYAATNACKALRTSVGGLALVGLVGDSLLEPFWPTGSGCARGFLSSFDAAWMCRQWAYHKCAVIEASETISPKTMHKKSSTGESGHITGTTNDRMALSVMAERESIYRILAQTTSENLQQNYSQWTLNPHTRYPNLNRHLITPSQVEHLMFNNEGKTRDKVKLLSPFEKVRKIKSPNSASARASPKKLRSANASPMSQRKNKSRQKLMHKNSYKSRSRPEMALDDTFLEFEKSYDFITSDERSSSQYIAHHTDAEDLLIPSISGTHPSSKNLLSLEKRRARDIDDCLRQRRQKAQLHILKGQLMNQFRNHGRDPGNSSDFNKSVMPGGAALFNELRRLREKQMTSKDSKYRDANGPLNLLNSMRRCASFAERVKSFESKLVSSNQESNPTTPKTPVDNVKNLPQFATLQELIINKSSTENKSEFDRRSKIHVMKLSKDDWNVKCWEDRLIKHKESKSTSGSTRSLNKSLSVDAHRPEKHVELFRGRIKEMADKLERVKGTAQNESSDRFVAQSNSWVKHLKRELVKSSYNRYSNDHYKPSNNSNLHKKPIKKLFDDADEDESGLDMNQHYDHLCINRPTNKYLSKTSGYTSHLRRSKYDSSNVVDLTPSQAVKKSNGNSLTSRGSSVSSTMSDGSIISSSGDVKKKQQTIMICSRCKELLRIEDRIMIEGYNLHKSCISCSDCGITLRTNEIRSHLHLLKDSKDNIAHDFICAMCRPINVLGNLNSDLNGDRRDQLQNDSHNERTRLSREEFLQTKIDYKELYKNIFDDDSTNNEVAKKINCLTSRSENSSSSRDSSSDDRTVRGGSITLQVSVNEGSLSPYDLRLPLDQNGKQVLSEFESSQTATDVDYRIVTGEVIDGVQQVTLEMPFEPCAPDSVQIHDERAEFESCSSEMADEDEINRIMCLDASTSVRASPCLGESDKISDRSSSGGDDETSDTSNESNSNDSVDKTKKSSTKHFEDDPSSLNSPPGTGEYDDSENDDDDDDDDDSSTNADFLTSEELGQLSDVEKDHELEESRGHVSKKDLTAEN